MYNVSLKYSEQKSTRHSCEDWVASFFVQLARVKHYTTHAEQLWLHLVNYHQVMETEAYNAWKSFEYKYILFYFHWELWANISPCLGTWMQNLLIYRHTTNNSFSLSIGAFSFSLDMRRSVVGWIHNVLTVLVLRINIAWSIVPLAVSSQRWSKLVLS